MSKTAKILVTICIVFVFFILFGAVVGVRESSGQKTPGILGLILFAALYGAIKAVWKSKKNDDNNSDSSMLQK